MADQQAPMIPRALTAIAVIGLLAACQRPAPADAGNAANATSVGDTATAVPASAAPRRFELTAIPLSDKPLGAFPYLTLPAGYRRVGEPATRDFDTFPFWVGDRFEWVEGKVYSGGFSQQEGKTFSSTEVSRNLESLITGLGGVRVSNAQIPAAALEQLKPKDVGVRYGDGLGDVYNYPAEVFVIRRGDRVIWIHLCMTSAAGGWVIAESAPFAATAVLLPAAALASELDKEGKVAVQINFATDRADLPDDASAQIAQIVQMLDGDPTLRLLLHGHTDNAGTRAHNQSLSEARAAAVLAALTAAGIATSRLQAAGFGQDQPVADNATEDGNARNRRVELVRQ